MQYKNFIYSGLLLVLVLPLQVFGSKITFYEHAPSLSRPGACGRKFIYDNYVSINAYQFDGNREKYCGACVKVVYKDKYIVGRVNDRCESDKEIDDGCVYGQIDIAPSMMDHFLGSRANTKRVGTIDAEWSFVSCDEYGKTESDGGSLKNTTISTTTTTIITSQIENTSTETQAIDQKNPANVTTTTEVEIKPAIGDDKSDTLKEIEEDEKRGERKTTYIIPITSAVMISGAAGVGLLYMKKINKYESISSQIKSITRSITTRGSSIGRSVTHSLKLKKRPTPPTLPTTNVANEVIDVTHPTKVTF